MVVSEALSPAIAMSAIALTTVAMTAHTKALSFAKAAASPAGNKYFRGRFFWLPIENQGVCLAFVPEDQSFPGILHQVWSFPEKRFP